MNEHFPSELLNQTLNTLDAEGSAATIISALTSALPQATLTAKDNEVRLVLGDHLLASRSGYGGLTFFLPPDVAQGRRLRLASFDRHGRLLLLLHWAPEGKLTHFKVRGLDGRFLGVMRSAATHLGWGESDSVWLLDGEEGFSLDRTLTLFRTVQYEDLDFLPPLDNPATLPAGGGSTVLNVLALLAQDQGKLVLRYRGPYPSDRLFVTLRESFRYSGEPGAIRERFTEGVETTALQLEMKEANVDWAPHPHERYFPAAHTCVQFRDGIEKIYDRGTIYYRSDLTTEAYAVWLRRREEDRPQYVTGLKMLGQALESHVVFDETGEIVERLPVKRDWDVRGGVQLSEEWKAMLARLISAESSSLLRTALWPEMEQLSFFWTPLRGRLWTVEGNEVFLHAGIAAVYREALARTKSAGERLLLAARFTSELARLIGPLIRARAQEKLSGLSSQDQQVALLFAGSGTHGLTDNELRKFLTRLAQGEEMPTVT
jgi:hypothetical protein